VVTPSLSLYSRNRDEAELAKAREGDMITTNDRPTQLLNADLYDLLSIIIIFSNIIIILDIIFIFYQTAMRSRLKNI
jgi:hypothetical protein